MYLCYLAKYKIQKDFNRNTYVVLPNDVYVRR